MVVSCGGFLFPVCTKEAACGVRQLAELALPCRHTQIPVGRLEADPRRSVTSLSPPSAPHCLYVSSSHSPSAVAVGEPSHSIPRCGKRGGEDAECSRRVIMAAVYGSVSAVKKTTNGSECGINLRYKLSSTSTSCLCCRAGTLAC